jgi:tyrosinase
MLTVLPCNTQILLILAWRMMYDKSPYDPECYYQIAGIHGAPYTGYNNTDGGSNGGGYCYHGSTLFPGEACTPLR